MDDVLALPATQVAARLKRKELSSHELTRAVLARVEEVNPTLNAVVEVSDRALADAAAADRAAAHGESLGPLHGVPITIKEAFHVEGTHTTWGEPAFRHYVADWDAAVVRRLRAAGAVLVAKTNNAHMLADFGQTANDVYGRTNNPWDTSRSAGGSGGGGAAAVASGLSFLDTGSDLAGSVRLPAAFCGVHGLRPTPGTVPSTGLQPPGPPPTLPDDTGHMLSIGPVARSAADLRTALRVTGGPEAPISHAYTWESAPPRHRRLRDFRVGFVLDHPSAPVSGEVVKVLDRLVRLLEGNGVAVAEGWPPGIDPERQMRAFGFHVGLFLALQQPEAAMGGLDDFTTHEWARRSARAAWAEYFGHVDVFLCPAAMTEAIPHDPRPWEQRTIETTEGSLPYEALSFWSAHASLAGLPVVVTPVGTTSAGHPVGAQVVGPAHEDDTAITFSELLDELGVGYQPPPECG